jgi:divalent metal cation (Fe/Co/Zn/Cd) transporter
VASVGVVKLRWTGHRLRAEAEIAVASSLTVAEAHAIALEAEHNLTHALPHLAAATVHLDPAGSSHVHYAVVG